MKLNTLVIKIYNAICSEIITFICIFQVVVDTIRLSGYSIYRTTKEFTSIGEYFVSTVVWIIISFVFALFLSTLTMQELEDKWYKKEVIS